MGIAIDRVGQEFGRLRVVRRAENSKQGQSRWECKCSCGGVIVATGGNLAKGGYMSCGCAKIKHGHARRGLRSPEYMAWAGIVDRCESPSCLAYARYGGRGISVCERWRYSFETFLADMGRKPAPGHSIDRVDNDGDYEPGNCRWATRSQQNRNRSSVIWITANGERLTATDWSRRLEGDDTLVHHRLGLGWTEEEAVLTPVGKRRPRIML